jgi:hypothetical protein
MISTKKNNWIIYGAAVFALIFLLASTSFSQELPSPNTVIDKNNYKKYSHLFPAEFLPIFEDGFGGLATPLVIKTIEKGSYPSPKYLVTLSEKNRGKFGVNAKGEITGVWDRNGLPFPDLDRKDKDFLIKLMWNYDARYLMDDATCDSITLDKRKNQPVRYNEASFRWLFFVNRLVESPKPSLQNPINAMKAILVRMTYPDVLKDFMTLTYRYVDSTKTDDTYVYVPSMRRVIRGEAGQRSTPLAGSLQSFDDYYGFDGRTPDFTYKIVAEQKILANLHSTFDVTKVKKMLQKTLDSIPYDGEGHEIRDVYVIDVIPKDSKYPQSKKRIWLDKEIPVIHYAVAWDRSGKFWKVWGITSKMADVAGGGAFAVNQSMFGIDVQFGMATTASNNWKMNNANLVYKDVSPAVLQRLGR